MPSLPLEPGQPFPQRARVSAAADPERRSEGPSSLQMEGAVPSGAVLRTLQAGVLTRAGFRHGFSTRSGGTSTVYRQKQDSAASGEMNLGFTASDAAENVRENRARLLDDVFGRQLPLATVQQTHSAVIHRVSEAGSTHTGDGLVTDALDVALGIMTADCVPVLLADPDHRAVGAFHAGWRGTLQRIVERGVGQMRDTFSSRPESLLAAIGPSIGPCCYPIGEEVAEQFRSHFAYADDLFGTAGSAEQRGAQLDRQPQKHLNLREANRRQLLDAGLHPSHIEVLDHCTACREDLFFSYRAQKGFCGRMLAVITAG